MAEAVVSIVLQKLGELIIDGLIAEAKFLQQVKEKVEEAKQELRMIRCFLKDAEKRARNGDETLALWVQEITDAAYDLDDVVSTFVLREEVEAEAAATKGVVRKVVGGLIKRPIKLHKVGSKIDKIFNRLSKLNQSLQRHGVRRDSNVGDSSSSNQRLNDLRRTYSHVPEHDFVGNEGGTMELVTRLTEKGKSGSPFVSIHGMGGLGKTTLAKMVFHQKQVRKHFKCFAWVFVSQQFQPKDIWKGVLLDLVSDPGKKKEIAEMERQEILAEKLYDVLQKQKCLVVLDDVWNTNDWDSLARPAFPEEKTHSKILITTRRRDVAEHASRRGFPYQPPHLDDAASWELLKKKANFQDDATSRGNYDRMEKLGKDMVKECRGLPLAIVVLGGLLSTKHTVDEWEAVKQNVKELINKGPSNGEQEYNTVSAVLGLSYDELPYDLKPCFLHLANFPEDYEINVKESCRLWTAEDFVSAEDKARECLMALVDRGMVQVGQLSSIVGRIKTCRIHDLMRELCLDKAKKENFFHRINFQVPPGDSLPIRRLAVHSNDNIVDGLPGLTNNRDRCRLRSLLCFAPEVEDLDVLMKPLFNRYKMLRAFKFEFNSFKDAVECRGNKIITNEIGKLIHLRLVSLKNCDQVFLLPPSMANLRCLQTLDLRIACLSADMNLSSRQSMNVLSKLDHLRHLYLPNFWSTYLEEDGLRLRLGNLTSLETLVNFDTGYCALDDLSQLTKLTKLSITTRQALGKINPTSNLQSLSVNIFSDDSSGGLRDIAPFLSSYPQIQKLRLYGKLVNSLENVFFPNLVKLTLGYTLLEVDPMSILGKLSKLRILALMEDSYCGKMMVCCKNSFPQLESLSLYDLHNLEELRVQKGALSKLRHLNIWQCSGLRNINTPKDIKLSYSNDIKHQYPHIRRKIS